MKSPRRPFAVLLLALGLAQPALATWSIVLVNTRTNEVCVAIGDVPAGKIASRANLAVIDARRRRRGAAQSTVDTLGTTAAAHLGRLPRGDRAGRHPGQPRGRPRQSPEPPVRDRRPRCTIRSRFSGTIADAAKRGVTGISGDLRYAIQGNVLAAAESVGSTAEAALLTTPGDVEPEGDGRDGSRARAGRRRSLLVPASRRRRAAARRRLH